MIRVNDVLPTALAALASFAAGVVLLIQLIWSQPVIWMLLALLLILGYGLRQHWKWRRLRPLLTDQLQPRQMRRVSPAELGASTEAELPRPFKDVLVKRLGSRRLVLVCGARSSGRTHAVHEALCARFGGHLLLRPSPHADPGRPPLTTLLSSGVLPWRRRHILWLGDVGKLLEAGFDPRLVERWMAFGRGRVAVGTITPADRRRLRESGTNAAVALERATFLPMPTQRDHRVSNIALRYRRESDPTARALMRIVATCQLLELPDCGMTFYDGVLTHMEGRALDPTLIERLTEGAHPPLAWSEETGLAAHPDLVAEIDTEIGRGFDHSLLDAMVARLPPQGLLTLGRALGLRRQLAEAEQAFQQAAATPGSAIQNAITAALTWLTDLREGPSGVSLINEGGLDFDEPMGLAQREVSAKLLEAGPPDPDFDPTLPPEEEGRVPGLYRLTVGRAVARLITLIFLDTLAVCIASVAAMAFRTAAYPDTGPIFGHDLLQLSASASAAMAAVALWLGLYRRDAARARIPLIFVATAIVSLLMAAGLFIVKADFGSVSALGAFFAAAFGLDCLLRFGYDRISRGWVRDRRLEPRVLLLGRKHEVRPVARSMRTRSGRPAQPVAYLSPTGQDDDRFCLGDYSLLELRLRELHIAEVVIADRDLSTEDKARLVRRAQSFGMDVRFLATSDEIVLGAVGRVDELGLVNVPAALIAPEKLELKRVIDRALVVASVPVWGTILAAYAIYSRWRRPGQPLFIGARRVGLGNSGFTVLQLRTRTVYEDNWRATRPTGRIEAFFEYSGLDELPQVINVLRDEMSIVGPRPISAADYADLTHDERRTLAARPGLTGRWQVAAPAGASEADMRAMDADYLRRWRVVHDIDLILRTPIAIWRRRRFNSESEIARRRELLSFSG